MTEHVADGCEAGEGEGVDGATALLYGDLENVGGVERGCHSSIFRV